MKNAAKGLEIAFHIWLTHLPITDFQMCAKKWQKSLLFSVHLYMQNEMTY